MKISKLALMNGCNGCQKMTGFITVVISLGVFYKKSAEEINIIGMPINGISTVVALNVYI